MTEPGGSNKSAKAHSENSPNITNSKQSPPGYNSSNVPRHSSLNSDTTDTDDDAPKDNGLVKSFTTSAPGPNSTSAKTMAIESRMEEDVGAPIVSRTRGSAGTLQDVSPSPTTHGWEGTANTNTAARERPPHEEEGSVTLVTGYEDSSTVVVAGRAAGSSNGGHLAVSSTVGVGTGSAVGVSQQHFMGVGRPICSNPQQHHNDNEGAPPTMSSGLSTEDGPPPSGQHDATATSSGSGVASVSVEGGRLGQGYATPSLVNPSHEGVSQSSNNIFPVPATPTRSTSHQQPQAPRAAVAQGEHLSLEVTSSHLQAGVSAGSTATGGHGQQLVPKFIRSGGNEDIASDLLKTGTPRRRRLVRLDNGSVVVLPTNIYRQAAGVKLDLSLGGLRLNGERPTMKNRAFNFGVMPGINRENILALRAFRNEIIPLDRNNTIHYLAAVEALRRYDEEHLKPPDGSESSSYEGSGGWIPDSQEVLFTVVGSRAELLVPASELRAVDFTEACKTVLEALKVNPDVLAGQLEPAPDNPTTTAITAKDEDVGIESHTRSGGVVASAESGGFQEPKRRGRKKKAVVAEDGTAYDLPKYVQHEKMMKNNRSTLKLKMPLAGYLVNGEEISVADLVVAGGLDVTPKNILALRGARDAVMMNFAGPPAVQRVVAAEIFHYWYKRRCSTASTSTPTSASPIPKDADGMEAGASATLDTPSGDAIMAEDGESESESAADGFAQGGEEGVSPRAPLSADAKARSDTEEDVGEIAGAVKGRLSKMPVAATAWPEEEPSTSSPQDGSTTAMDVDADADADADGDAGTSNRAAEGAPPAADSNAARSSAASISPTHSGEASPSPEAGGTSSHALVTVEARSAVGAFAGLNNDDILIISGPPTDQGGTRLEVHMAVRDLIAARAQRAIVFRHLVEAMMGDPVVQSGQLEIVAHRSTANDMPSAAPRGGGGEMMPYLPHVQSQQSQAAFPMTHNTTAIATPLDGGASSSNGYGERIAGVGGNLQRGCDEMDAASLLAAKVQQPPLDRPGYADWSGSRAVGTRGGSGGGGGGGGGGGVGRGEGWERLAVSGGDERGGRLAKREREAEEQCNGTGKRASGVGAGSRGEGGGGGGGGGSGAGSGDLDLDEFGSRSPLSAEAAMNSKRRRQLWMREISLNERRYERRKEEARRHFEARQQQLLRWMVNEEAGRHDGLDGNAGPPPDDDMN